MANLVFYEKPSCVGNKQQKAYLNSLGITLEVRDLLSEAWTAESLRPFFGGKPVKDWFNETAPRIKTGEINRFELDEEQALALMVEEPLLIKRPLMQYEQTKQSGFISGPVFVAANIQHEETSGLHTCPMVGE